MYFITLTDFESNNTFLININDIDHVAPFIPSDDFNDENGSKPYWLVTKRKIVLPWERKEVGGESKWIKESPEDVEAKIQNCLQQAHATPRQRRGPKPS